MAAAQEVVVTGGGCGRTSASIPPDSWRGGTARWIVFWRRWKRPGQGLYLKIVIITLFSSTQLIIVYEKVSLHSLTINMELQNFKYQI